MPTPRTTKQSGGVQPGGGHAQVRQHVDADRHDHCPDDRQDLVAAGPAGHLTRDQRGHRRAEHQRDQRQAAARGRVMLDGLLEERQEGQRAEHGQAEQQAHRGGQREVTVPEDVQRQHRLGGPGFDHEECGQRQCGDDSQHDDLPGAPRVLAAAPAGHQHDRRRSDRDDCGAQVVDLVLHSPARQVQRGPQVDQRGPADRHVDVEDPAPGPVLRDVTADQRPGDHRHHHRGHHVAHVLAALAGGHQVTDGGDRADHQAAGAEALQGAEGDQLVHGVREAGQRRADQEQHDRDHQESLAAVHVTELAVEQRGDGGRQNVGRHHPRQVVQAAEVADDARQRSRDDQLVEHRDDEREQQTWQHDQDLAPPPGWRVAQCRGRRLVVCH